MAKKYWLVLAEGESMVGAFKNTEGCRLTDIFEADSDIVRRRMAMSVPDAETYVAEERAYEAGWQTGDQFQATCPYEHGSRLAQLWADGREDGQHQVREHGSL